MLDIIAQNSWDRKNLDELVEKYDSDPNNEKVLLFNNNNNNNNIYSGSSTHRSVFQGGPVIYIYIIHGILYYAYLKTIKYLQVDYICLGNIVGNKVVWSVCRGVATGRNEGVWTPPPPTLFFGTKFVILPKLRRNWGGGWAGRNLVMLSSMT